MTDLRQQIAALDAPSRSGGSVAFGVDDLDRRLADGGLARGGLHEVAAAAPSLAEDAATTLFLAGIATRAQPRDDRELLAVMEDTLRHGGLSAVVGEARRIDMTATRRLQLAAADARTPALVLRRWRKRGSCPLDEPSAATTRWRIGCAPSAPLDFPGVGRPRWAVELVRQRNGNPFTLVLEGCDAQGRLGLPALSADRAAGAGRHTHAA